MDDDYPRADHNTVRKRVAISRRDFFPDNKGPPIEEKHYRALSEEELIRRVGVTDEFIEQTLGFTEERKARVQELRSRSNRTSEESLELELLRRLSEACMREQIYRRRTFAGLSKITTNKILRANKDTFPLPDDLIDDFDKLRKAYIVYYNAYFRDRKFNLQS